MVRGWTGLFMVVAVAVAGCVDPPMDHENPTDESDSASRIPWGLTDCRYGVSWGWVDEDRLATYLPQGFSARAGGSPLPGASNEAVLFGVDVMICASGRTVGGEASGMQFGYVWAAADPPAGFVQDDIEPSEHYVKWDVLVPDADRREVLEKRGVPVRDGSASLVEGPLGPEGTLELTGIGSIGIQGVVTGEWEPFDGTFVKFTSAEQGAAAWRAHALSGPRSNGQAVLSFPEGSWMADVANGTVLTGGFHSGSWSYEDAQVLFLPRD